MGDSSAKMRAIAYHEAEEVLYQPDKTISPIYKQFI